MGALPCRLRPSSFPHGPRTPETVAAYRSDRKRKGIIGRKEVAKKEKREVGTTVLSEKKISTPRPASDPHKKPADTEVSISTSTSFSPGVDHVAGRTSTTLKPTTLAPTPPAASPYSPSVSSRPKTGLRSSRPSPERTGMMTPAGVLRNALPLGGWRLGSCWGPNCSCEEFDATPTAQSAGSEHTVSMTSCSCGHHAVAHELVDSGEEDSGGGPPRVRYSWVASDRPGPGGRGTGAPAAGRSEARILRRLFVAIRNARAIGDSGVFEDSEGICGWGAGWFLTR